jgi:WD40 repeat protein/tRNA A-37 threonylcarbamoyl transferase component Bud32
VQVTDDPRVGTQLAGYRIESLLGLGGMSVVYLAEDLRLKRRVALKLLAASLAEDESFRDRFLRESELAASIDHPNIVPIYEAGTTEEHLFIAMRYVEGRDLKERLQEGRLEPADAIGLLAQVASALDAAHARGLVHRDVKPSNVLLDRGARPDGSDHVYLADFGLTKRVSEETGIADDGRLMGTIDYVAPEQIAGEDVDGRADVYSLACVLYESLVGRPPYGGDSELAVVFSHLEAEPPTASAERPDLPAGLDAVLATALAKNPDQRYTSCRELARAALSITVDEASRRLADAAARAAAGRSDLGEAEAELAGKVTELQLAQEQARALSTPVTPTRVPADGVCPFKGLASFEPVDAEYYFGRERLVAELVARLVGSGFLGIVGPSGSGKSSVLRAGLLPALAGGVLPGSGGWRRWLLRPGEHPLEALRTVLVSGASDPLAEALDGLPADTRLLIAVDQLEELFTACRSGDEQAAFADTLVCAAADPRAVVVVAVRADFYGRFAAYPGLAELLGANHVLVGPMQASELRRAVELPAARVGLHVEPELTDMLVGDVEGEPGALPLLSTALLELWQKREDTALTLAAYRESGGVHGAVARLAESTYARIPDTSKPLVRAVMLRLVGEGEGDAPVRRRAPLAELDLERNEELSDVVSTLADSRLVTVGEGSVEVAHEALLREWPRLGDWIDEDSVGRRLRHHIAGAAHDWSDRGRDQGELYRGARLAAALDWSTDHAFELNELEREFVSESREASERDAKRTRRTNRRLRALLAGVAALLAAAVAGGVFALVQRAEAQDAETAQLAQRLGAQALVEEDFDLSLLLARQAVALDDSPQTRGYLLADLLRSPAAVGIMHGATGGEDDLVRALAVSPDGNTLAVGDGGGLRFFETRTYEQIGEDRSAASFVDSIAYSPNGRTLALASGDGIRLLDAETHEQLEATHLSGASRLAFSRDGSRLVAVASPAERPGAIWVLDSSTLEPVGSPIEPAGFQGWWFYPFWINPSIALAPDGRSLIATSQTGGLTWWDLRSREKTKTVAVEDGYRAVALSPDGRTAAIGLEGGVRLIDVRTGAARESGGTLPTNPTWLLFSPDGKTLVSTGSDGMVTLWDVDPLAVRETLRGHSEVVWQPVFSPDGETLYTASNDGTVIAWDVTQRRRFGRQFTFARGGGGSGWPYEYPARFSPNGRLIAVGLKNKGIELRDAGSLARVAPPLVPTGGEVAALAFTPDGRTLAAVSQTGVATLWDTKSRSLLRRPFRVDRISAIGASISADGTMLATAGPDGVHLWDTATGKSLGHIGHNSGPGDIAFSPKGSLVAFVRDGYLEGGGGDIEVWDAARRVRITKVLVEGVSVMGWAIAFSPDGRTIATGGLDPLVHLRDARTGKLLRELEQNVGSAVLSLAFSPDGKTLAMSGGEAFAALWDVATGVPLGPRLRVGGREVSLDVSRDGQHLLTTHADGQATIWTIDQDRWAQRACGLANRTLTRAEWDEFLPGRPYEPAC